MIHPAFDLHAYYEAETADHLQVARATFQELEEPFSLWVAASVLALKNGKKLLFFGNGGSASDAQHLATELTVRYIADRKAIAAIALTTDSSALTAIGNDLGFQYLFSRQIEAIGQEGDMAIGLSTSGKSPNVLRALEVARAKGLVTVGLTGSTGGQLPPLTDILLKVPSLRTARIQEMHITLGQMLCGAIEHGLGLVD